MIGDAGIAVPLQLTMSLARPIMDGGVALVE